MTIMTETHGGKTRHCNGACHHAKGPTCNCICGGRYHGAGMLAQELLTRDWLGDDWREQKAAIKAAGGSFTAVVSEALCKAAEITAPPRGSGIQLLLFDGA